MLDFDFNRMGGVTINSLFKQEIEENLKVGLLDIVILKLLSSEDLYGYQIKQEISNRSNGKIEIKDGSLYGPLYRMEKKNFISSTKKLVGEKRFRVYYQITDLGKEYLETAIKTFNSIYSGADLILN